MRDAWNVEGGMWNEKCAFARKEEGVRRKEKCESARKCVECGRWNVEGGMWNEKCESARKARGRKERGHFKLKCPLSF